MKHTVCVVTGSRAEFGLLLPLLQKLHTEPTAELRLVVTGSHLSQAFGNTVTEIERADLPIHARIPLPLGQGTAEMIGATAAAMSAFGAYFAENRPDLLVVLGDRYEIFGACTAAAMHGIPIAHLHGGETTEGAVDEFLRHAITKMSYLHFTSCEAYRRRVIQLGEAPERVFNVGASGVENALHTPLLSLAELQENLSFDLTSRPYAVVTFHPVTLEQNTAERQMAELIAAMDSFPAMGFIVTKANADAGGAAINAIWDEAAKDRPNWYVTPSLGMKRYLSALKSAQMMLGNSSSGIIEAPAMHIPTVNIGDRQKGRMMAESILSCPPERSAIVSAMTRALTPEFQALAHAVSCPFGDGTTSEKITAALLRFLNRGDFSTKKQFYDVEFSL